MVLGSPRVESGASWSGTLEVDGVDHLVSQVPVLGESEDAVGAHLGTVMVAERRAVDLGAAAGHLVLPAHLPRHRARRRAGRLLAALPPDQAPDPRDGAARDRRPRRAPRGDAARHRRGRDRARPAAPDHPGQRGGAPAARPARARDRAPRSTTCASRAGCARSSSARTPAPGHRRRRARRPRHRGPRRGGHPARPGARHEHDAGGERRPRARHGHDDARPHRARRPRAGDRVVPLDAHVLRAQAHEFANQLHTISGLIQIGELDEVVRYVDALSERRDALDLTVNTLVRDPTIAALLMAKVATANERRVELTHQRRDDARPARAGGCRRRRHRARQPRRQRAGARAAGHGIRGLGQGADPAGREHGRDRRVRLGPGHPRRARARRSSSTGSRPSASTRWSTASAWP